MNRDKRNDSTPPQLVSLFRGLYNRVARKMGVDPSYVSRVARGERRSEAVLAALTEEVKSALARLGPGKQRSRKTPKPNGRESEEMTATLDREVESLLATVRRSIRGKTRRMKRDRKKKRS